MQRSLLSRCSRFSRSKCIIEPLNTNLIELILRLLLLVEVSRSRSSVACVEGKDKEVETVALRMFLVSCRGYSATIEYRYIVGILYTACRSVL